MAKSETTVFKKITDIEKSIQELKIDLFFGARKIKQPQSLYKESEILDAVREIRREIWNEKYSKAV